MYQRAQIRVLKERLSGPRLFIQVLSGPRQTGKTTLAGQLLKQFNIPWIMESADAVPAGNTIWLEQLWEGARLKMRAAASEEFLLVIDEIQKINGWSEMVKRLWDEDTRNGLNIKLLLLGSSRLLLQKGLTESLTGRFEIIYFPHWNFSEMNEAFGWSAEKYAWFGGYPGSVSLVDDEPRWKRYLNDSIIETSISRDILMLTRIDKPAMMKKLFELGCLYSGQILSYSKIVGQLQEAGNTTTLAHYLDILNSAGLLGGLEKFSANIIRKRSSSPKFQVHNNALINAQRGELFSGAEIHPGEWGRIVESAIGAHLLNNSPDQGYSVYYWREAGNEVDFILEQYGKLAAIEVKSVPSDRNKGMDVFKRKYQPQRIYLVDNKNLSWKEFLGINPAELF